MTERPRIQAASTFIRDGDVFHFQRRRAGVDQAGQLGTFAGKIEDGETPHVTISRELAEETNLRIPPDRFRLLGLLDVNVEPYDIDFHVFTVDANGDFRTFDGERVALTAEEIESGEYQFTPGTTKAIDNLDWRN